ncbi:MAG: helix-turn-helix transcriptional regulator [Collinsella sp.]|nr:helix-turn-helix transcriptional regulator [Collinsella sp.]
MNVETAQRLADLRRSKGFSQEGLARKLGLSRQAVSKWERAESSPDTENLISLAKLYGVSLDELLNPSDEIEDDIEFENEDRARQREAEAAERARTHEAAARATEAATQASDAAAKAAQAASWSAQAANAATAQVTGTGAVNPTPVKGPFQSFPYWAVCWLLFFLLMFLFGGGPFAALIFFTIPIYHWVARALDGDWARGDIQVGPAPVAVRAQDVSAAVDTDVATATSAEPSVKEGDE